jgi:hypothetical protein
MRRVNGSVIGWSPTGVGPENSLTGNAEDTRWEVRRSVL